MLPKGGCFMKKYYVPGMIFLLFTAPIYAEQPKDQPKKEPQSLSETSQEIKDTMAKQAEDIDKMTQISIDCEYDIMCLYKKVEDLAKNDSNPLFKEYYKNLQSNYSSIEFEHKNCSTDDIKATKHVLAECNKDILAKIKTTEKIESKEKLQQQMQSCYQPKIEKLATDGNIFAQHMMVNFSKDGGDNKAVEKWKKAIEDHKGKPEYETYQKCSSKE